MTALEGYRQTQAKLRRLFEPLTAELCASCLDPCCRVPTRVTPLDVMIALACGWQPEADLIGGDAVEAAARQASEALPAGLADDLGEQRTCPFLGCGGCTFPPDLRPFGCTVYVCRPMLRRLDARRRARLRRLAAELAAHYARLAPRDGRQPG